MRTIKLRQVQIPKGTNEKLPYPADLLERCALMTGLMLQEIRLRSKTGVVGAEGEQSC